MNSQFNMHLTGGGDDDRRIYFPGSLLHTTSTGSFMNTKINTSENILIFYINNSLIIIKILFTF